MHQPGAEYFFFLPFLHYLHQISDEKEHIETQNEYFTRIFMYQNGEFLNICLEFIKFVVACV